MNTSHFNSFDGAELFYREWNFQPGQKTIIVIHRGHEHSGRLAPLAESATFAPFNIFAFDLRGHGHTKTENSSVFMDYVRDLDFFAHHLKAQYGVETRDLFILANSIGGVIAAAWAHSYAPPIAGMALLAPAFRINLIVPGAGSMIALGAKMKKGLIIKSYVKATMLTHDVEEQKAYDADPLITRAIDAALLTDLEKAGKRLVGDAAAIDTPTLILSAEQDKVVFNKDQKLFFDRLDTPLKKLEVLPGFFHGILFEVGREAVYEKIKDFATECFSAAPKKAGLQPDRFSLEEEQSIRAGVGNNANFKFQKWSLPKIGKISKGMSVGIKHGFDSGVSLDYVYHNTPQGAGALGKMMDKNYLNAIGWRGIRIRKQHLLQLLSEAIEKLQLQGREIKILDIAGGTGNYLFDVKDKFPDAEIVVNEFIKDNIEVGEAVIKAKNYQNVRFANFDCFDPATYPKLHFRPNIVIISGILELFGDNELASKALQGINAIAEPNSTVLYTGQPWHPQLQMIAYVLNSHQKKDWVMRRRSQKELDRMMAHNGIQKEQMLVDDFGIFTVSAAQVNGES